MRVKHRGSPRHGVTVIIARASIQLHHAIQRGSKTQQRNGRLLTPKITTGAEQVRVVVMVLVLFAVGEVFCFSREPVLLGQEDYM